MSKYDGGPAFPVIGHGIDEPYRGMTLRDYFAAKALQGLLADEGDIDDFWARAEFAYGQADAMLAERAK